MWVAGTNPAAHARSLLSRLVPLSGRAEPLPVFCGVEERPDDGVVVAVAVQVRLPEGPAACVRLAPQVVEVAPADELVVVEGVRRVARKQPRRLHVRARLELA